MKKNTITWIILGIIIVLLVVGIVYFGAKEENKEKVSTSSNSTKNQIAENKENKKNNNQTDYEEAAKRQMAEPEKGEVTATIKVKDFGNIKVKFFKDSAPKAVENFIKHSKDGYYDGTTFHRVMEEFMIQGGDPKGDGTGGESIWGDGFEEEIDLELVPYRGALCMASAGTGTSTIGSQFFIVQANYSEDMEKTLSEVGFPEDLLKQYKTYGGYLSLYGGYTVFGQVVEGMDVVDEITKVEKTLTSRGELSSPTEKIIIETIEVSE